MDPAVIVSVLLFIASILLGINAFFLRNLVVKLEVTSISTTTNNVKIEFLEKQMSEVSRMRDDVGQLKVAIMGYLKGRDE